MNETWQTATLRNPSDIQNQLFMNNLQTGIWLDFRDAYLISMGDDAQMNVHHIHSKIHHHATKGGSRSKAPWGPQHSPADDTSLEQDNHTEQQYFQEIIQNLSPQTEDLVIFGPAEAKIGLKKAIEQIKHFKAKVCAMLPSDYLTPNEMTALIREYFLHPEKYLVHDKE